MHTVIYTHIQTHAYTHKHTAEYINKHREKTYKHTFTQKQIHIHTLYNTYTKTRYTQKNYSHIHIYVNISTLTDTQGLGYCPSQKTDGEVGYPGWCPGRLLQWTESYLGGREGAGNTCQFVPVEGDP